MARLSGGSGVSYATFCQIMTELDDGGATLEDLIGAFKQFDRDGAGTHTRPPDYPSTLVHAAHPSTLRIPMRCVWLFFVFDLGASQNFARF